MKNPLANNLFVTSKKQKNYEFTNPATHEILRPTKKPETLLNPLSIFKALKDILQRFKFVNL